MRIVRSLFLLTLFSIAFNSFSQDSPKTKKVIRKTFRISTTSFFWGIPKWRSFSTGFSGSVNDIHSFTGTFASSNYGSGFSDPYYNLFRTVTPIAFPAGIPVKKQNYSLRYSYSQPKNRVRFEVTYDFASSQADYSQQKNRYYYSDSITDMAINTHSSLNSSNHRLKSEFGYHSKKYSHSKTRGYSISYYINANWYKQSAQIQSSAAALYKPDSSKTYLSNSINGRSKEQSIAQTVTYYLQLPIGNFMVKGDYNTTRRTEYDSLFNTGTNTANPLLDYNNTQRVQSHISKDDYKLTLQYSKRVSLYYIFDLQDHTSDRLNTSNVAAEHLSSLFSNTMHFQKRSNKIRAEYGRTIRGITFHTSLSYEVVSVNTKESFPQDVQVLNTYHNPGVEIRMEAPMFTLKAGKLSGTYHYYNDQPDITQLQPYTDNTQLNQWFSGNRGLTQTTVSSWSLYYNIPKLFKRIKADITGTLTNTFNERAAVIQLISPDSLYGGLWQAYKGSPMFSYANLDQQQSGNIQLNTLSRITKKINFEIKAGSQWYSFAEVMAQNYTGIFKTELAFKFRKAVRSGKLSMNLHTNHLYKPAMISNNVYFMNSADYTADLRLSFSVFELFKVNAQHSESFKNISFSQNAYEAFDLRIATSSISFNKSFYKRFTAEITGTQTYTEDFTHHRTFDNHFLNTSMTYKSPYGVDIEFYIQNILNRNTQVGQTVNTYYIETYSNSNLGRVFFLKLVFSPESFVRKITINLKKGAKPKWLIDLKDNRYRRK